MIWHLIWSLAILLFIFDNAGEQREEKRGWVGGINKPIINPNLGNKQSSKLLFCAVFLT